MGVICRRFGLISHLVVLVVGYEAVPHSFFSCAGVAPDIGVEVMEEGGEVVEAVVGVVD